MYRTYGDFGQLMLSMVFMSIMGAISSLIFLGLGWFAYGDVGGGLLIMLLAVVYGACVALAAIPYIGFIIQAAVAYLWVWPAFSQITGLPANWLTTVLFVMFMIYGFICTATTTAAIR